MTTIFIRLCQILFGYVLAILAASLFLHLLAWPSLGLGGSNPPMMAETALVVSLLLAALFISYYAFVPAIVVLAIAEIRPFRSWLYFAVAGGVTAMAAIALFQLNRVSGGGTVHESALGADTMGGAFGAGIVAGIAYWLIAGRSAGNWRRRETISPARSGS